MKKIILMIVALVALGSVTAKGVPGIRTEFGVVAGAHYPVTNFNMGNSTASLKATPGFTAGLHMGLRLVGILGIQPELLYSYNKINITDEKQNFSSHITCNTIQVPVLVSLRLALVRFNIGPVFTVMDNPSFADRNGNKALFGSMYPTVSYSVGASICLFKHLLIDARVMSGLKATENCLSYDNSHGEYIKSTTFNAQLKVGFLF